MNPIKIKRVLSVGNLSKEAANYKSSDDLLQDAGQALDKHCSHEIIGTPLFEGEDGKFYQMTVTAVIDEITEEEAE